MIQGYEKIREISRGPLTSVILCRQESLDREILLKILHPQHAKDKEIVERFIREAKLYAKLKHDNIVNVIDLGQDNGSYYIAMEFVDGWSLEQFFKNHPNLPQPISTYIIKKVVAGLNYAHKSGVIHRDIKPSNILIGKDGSVKITDFGLAKPENLSSITEQGNILGTPAYLAPELAKSQPASEASDIFALGVSCYELLSGQKIFLGATVAETISNILNKKPELLHKKAGEIPEWLSNLLGQMIAKKPEQRPQNCEFILQEIENNNNNISKADFYKFIQNPEMNSVKSSEPDLPRKQTKKIRPVYAVAAVFVIIILGVFSYQQFFDSSAVNESFTKNITEKINKNPLPYSDSATNQSEVKDTLRFSKKQIAFDQQLKPESEKNSEFQPQTKLNINSEKILTERFGYLSLTVIPWAEIWINGEKIDTTPLKKPIELLPGVYKLELKNPAYANFEKSIEITANRNDSVSVKLQEAFGNLILNVVPWGKIYINGEYIDVTPISEPIKVKSGQNELQIENPNFARHSELIDIQPGETLEKTIYLKN